MKRPWGAHFGAGRRNRTDITSLEDWGFTTKLCPLNFLKASHSPFFFISVKFFQIFYFFFCRFKTFAGAIVAYSKTKGGSEYFRAAARIEKMKIICVFSLPRSMQKHRRTNRSAPVPERQHIGRRGRHLRP